MYSQMQAIEELEQLSHCILSPEGVKELGEPFNVYQTKPITDNRSEFKGAHIDHVNEGETVNGLGAHELAMLICKKLNLSYPHLHGKGSQLRACCEVVKQHLAK